mgnify:FL=1
MIRTYGSSRIEDITGSLGFAGPSGPIGAIGATGATGATGHTGPAGPIGSGISNISLFGESYAIEGSNPPADGDGGVSDKFGKYGIREAGDYKIFGDPRHNTGGGRVRVYKKGNTAGCTAGSNWYNEIDLSPIGVGDGWATGRNTDITIFDNGDVVVVAGAEGAEVGGNATGAVYVWKRDYSTEVWTQVQEIGAPGVQSTWRKVGRGACLVDAKTNSLFFSKAPGQGSDTQSAFIWHFTTSDSGDTWTENTTWTAKTLDEIRGWTSSTDDGGISGFSDSQITEDRMILAAHADDAYMGGITIYEYTDSTWQRVFYKKGICESGSPCEPGPYKPSLGLDSAIHKDIAVAGSPNSINGHLIPRKGINYPPGHENLKVGENANYGAYNGSVFVYRRNSDGNWTHSQLIDNPFPEAGANFGHGVDLWKNILVIGACGAGNHNNATDGSPGRVYIYKDESQAGGPSKFVLKDIIYPSKNYVWVDEGGIAGDSVTGIGWGIKISYRGGDIAVGAPSGFTGGAPTVGSAFILSEDYLNITISDVRDESDYDTEWWGRKLEYSIGVSGAKGPTGTDYNYEYTITNAGENVGAVPSQESLNYGKIYKTREGATAYFRTLTVSGNAISINSTNDYTILLAGNEYISSGGIIGNTGELVYSFSGASAQGVKNTHWDGTRLVARLENYRETISNNNYNVLVAPEGPNPINTTENVNSGFLDGSIIPFSYIVTQPSLPGTSTIIKSVKSGLHMGTTSDNEGLSADIIHTFGDTIFATPYVPPTRIGSCCYCKMVSSDPDFPEREGTIPDCLDFTTDIYCDSIGGSFNTIPCANRPEGPGCYKGSACCVGGSCINTNSEKCTLFGGFYIDNTDCEEVEYELGGCPATCEDHGACCVGNLCYDLTEVECSFEPNSTWSAGKTCKTYNCCFAQLGGCCVDEMCYETSPYICSTLFSVDGTPGVFWGTGSSCAGPKRNTEAYAPYECLMDDGIISEPLDEDGLCPDGELPPCRAQCPGWQRLGEQFPCYDGEGNEVSICACDGADCGECEIGVCSTGETQSSGTMILADNTCWECCCEGAVPERPVLFGACCVDDDPDYPEPYCDETNMLDCAMKGGMFMEGLECSDETCNFGACCDKYRGTCRDETYKMDCMGVNEKWYGICDGVACTCDDIIYSVNTWYETGGVNDLLDLISRLGECGPDCDCNEDGVVDSDDVWCLFAWGWDPGDDPHRFNFRSRILDPRIDPTDSPSNTFDWNFMQWHWWPGHTHRFGTYGQTEVGEFPPGSYGEDTIIHDLWDADFWASQGPPSIIWSNFEGFYTCEVRLSWTKILNCQICDYTGSGGGGSPYDRMCKDCRIDNNYFKFHNNSAVPWLKIGAVDYYCTTCAKRGRCCMGPTYGGEYDFMAHLNENQSPEAVGAFLDDLDLKLYNDDDVVIDERPVYSDCYMTHAVCDAHMGHFEPVDTVAYGVDAPRMDLVPPAAGYGCCGKSCQQVPVPMSDDDSEWMEIRNYDPLYPEQCELDKIVCCTKRLGLIETDTWEECLNADFALSGKLGVPLSPRFKTIDEVPDSIKDNLGCGDTGWGACCGCAVQDGVYYHDCVMTKDIMVCLDMGGHWAGTDLSLIHI